MLGEYRIEGRRAVEIAASVERAVGSGGLAPGELLPPMRELAVELGVNPNTVAAAYRSLRDRGVIETAGRRGSRVRPRPATTSREAIGVDVPEGVRDLATGNPDPALLPSFRAALAAVSVQYEHQSMFYGAPLVSAPLARLAQAQLAADGVPKGPITVVSGALDGVERVLAAHLRPGDVVAVEDPGWGGLLDLIPALGLRPEPVALDDEGPLPAEVERAVRRGARALVVTSRAQNPTGAAVSADRCRELRTLLAESPELLLIEDDHGHGIVDLPLHALAGATDRWVLVRSTAKAYGPDLRLAVLTGDPTTVDRVGGRLRLGPGWVSHLLQDTVRHLWETEAVRPERVAASYAERRDALRAALAEQGIEAFGRSGMNVWVPVPDETVAVSRLQRAGWAVAPGARFRMASPPGIRLTVSGIGVEEVDAVADAVAASVRPASPGRYG
ncbi:aminotransferase class I/II-fold pyridoxal phosphate-dependent enzyme [Streptomyces sp. 796.1]|uniref:aminotransferase class I/II-fold pyridoxal phosphate-dependent enzyme n=1 Tax=Streptomyces sp. 796.1 TaxID=3163029 RepID=UPI0039C95E47